MCVNLSGIQLRDEGVVNTVKEALSDSGLGAESLCLEITETSVVGEGNTAVDTLCDLRALGVKLAIDDFGTGHSSLSYLKNLQVDWLKIDQSFVHELCKDGKSESILIAIIELAHALGMEVIAEGVESAEQLRRLTELGCDMAQGYYIARPTSSEKAFRFLTRHSS
jgi:EAL domain-containing protein (putative c-di-GMP-specific phosphodiesterase class I)